MYSRLSQVRSVSFSSMVFCSSPSPRCSRGECRSGCRSGTRPRFRRAVSPEPRMSGSSRYAWSSLPSCSDAPLHPVHVAGRADERRDLRRGHIGDGRAEVPAIAVAEISPLRVGMKEDRFRNGVRLNTIDGITLLGATLRRPTEPSQQRRARQGHPRTSQPRSDP